MLKNIRTRLLQKISDSHKFDAFRHSTFVSAIVFLIIINSASALFLGNPKEVVAADINTVRLIELANQERVARGLNTLIVDSRLSIAAQNKGADMFAKQYWSHYGPNGETPWQFIKAAGYNYIYAGENLAKDFTSTDPIHTAWMNSPSHRDNIININYQHIGIAAVSGVFDGKETIIVVQMFGSEYVAPEPEPEPTPEPDPEPTPPAPVPPAQPSSPDTIPPDKPDITEPADGDVLVTSELNVKGTAENNAEVAIYDGDEQIGTLNTEGGVFDYQTIMEDGEHILGATATDFAGNMSDRSDDVNVTVDTMAPEVEESTFQIIEWNEETATYLIKMEVSGLPTNVSIILGEYTVDLENIVGDFWHGEFDPEKSDLLENDRKFYVITVDEAGNEAEIELEIPQFETSNSNYLDLLPVTGEGDGGGVWEQVVSHISDFFTNSSLIKKINIVVGIVLIILAVIDIYFIWKGSKSRRGSRSASHLPILILLLIALLFAATGLIL